MENNATINFRGLATKLGMLEDVKEAFPKVAEEVNVVQMKLVRTFLFDVDNSLRVSLNECEVGILKNHKNKIAAIKAYRDRTGFSLKTAKETVEEQMLTLGIGERSQTGYIEFKKESA